ncbi:MAG: EutN/CcmL family microcompartment protein [Lachnospirales bacterium]
MKLAKVIGTVVATRKDETLVGCKLMIIRQVDSSEEYIGAEEVAVDYVGAGVGELVLIGQGSAVRVQESRKNTAIDLAIIGIVESMVIN